MSKRRATPSKRYIRLKLQLLNDFDVAVDKATEMEIRQCTTVASLDRYCSKLIDIRLGC